MGSWSVYCGFSKITITAGTRCVLLPIRKFRNEYFDYCLYCLPIFGKYNDYGGIEDIERDFNTDIIEKIHKCSVEEFCQYIIDREIEDYEDDDEERIEGAEDQLSKLITEDVTYMWMHGDVYDFLAKTYRPNGFHRAGSFDFGNPNILEKLGFQYAGESGDSRYKSIYKYNEHVVFSDGTWAHFVNNQNQEGFYDLQRLKEKIPTIDTSYFENKEEGDLFEIYNTEQRFEKLHFALGYDRSLLSMLKMKELVLAAKKSRGEDISNENDDDFLIEHMRMTYMQQEYLPLFEKNNEFCQAMADIIRLIRNGTVYSQRFEPFMQYLTPQCGEFEMHQGILEKFAEINKSHIR